MITAARVVATGNSANFHRGHTMPVINSEMINALGEAQGVSREKAMAAAAIIGRLEQQMLAHLVRTEHARQVGLQTRCDFGSTPVDVP
jgi:hypothetical protein